MSTLALQPLVISAPFGNYVQPTGATPTLGTFTTAARPGRVWRTIKTVRYYPRLRAWVNKIGLRNPGIDWLADRARAGRIDVSDKLVSIHGFDHAQWTTLLEKTAALKPLAIELNMSCPNVGEIDWPGDLFERAAASAAPIIVKLPPVNYQLMARQAIDAGIVAMHCCNTLPVAAGGLSGQPLKPVALQCIRAVRAMPGGDALTIIGGGGVREPGDVDHYAQAGANRVAVGTRAMNPRCLWSDRPLRPIIERAQAHWGSPAAAAQQRG